MDKKLAEAIIRLYGTQCEPYLTEIDRRLVITITALLYTGTLGDTPHAELNKLFEAME